VKPSITSTIYPNEEKIKKVAFKEVQDNNID
jgi:hypothetical protein